MAPSTSDIDWPPRHPRRRRGPLAVLLVLAVILFGGGTSISYYVDALWFGSLGYGAVFWKALDLQAVIFGVFAGLTFVFLYGAFRALKPKQLGTFGQGIIMLNGRPVQLPVEPVLNLIALAASLVIALITGAGMVADWPTLALWWYATPAHLPAATAAAADPIFGRPIAFYLFTLPAWQLIAGWLMTLVVIAFAIALFFYLVAGSTHVLQGRHTAPSSRGLAITWALVLVMLAIRTYLGRFDRLFGERTIFSGVSYTDAHVALTGLLIVAAALLAGAAIAAFGAATSGRVRWLVASIVPGLVCYVGLIAVSSYVSSFIVKPNQLVRERPYITHNIELTRRAYGLDQVTSRPFAADPGIAAADPAHNQATIQNIRLWDWRALQDTLRQIQEIRTYYDFPDIDIDRYTLGGTVRQVMLAARELSIPKLPESSRNWINEKLIYTHGYGVTMNPVNGFTPEGLPTLMLSNMPVESTVPGLHVTRPEIYFGELTDTDVYVKTHQKEFDYPQGQENQLNSYAGTGGIVIGGMLRRVLLAIDRGDLAKLPFSDDVTSESRLLMHRNVRDRVASLAPFLTFDPDPYIVVRDNGRLAWIMDGFTLSDSYPYSREYELQGMPVNYVRNSVKAVIDAYDGTTTFYVFDKEDPVIAGYRAIFPTLFKDASAMPTDLRRHVRYPQLLLELQAKVYGLYHMTDAEVFYNREDLWTVASEVGTSDQREQAAQPMEPTFVLMTLPGDTGVEFVEILPFTPANRNNLIGWIAARSDAPHYGEALAYDFPKTRLVDGPLQVEARIDQNAQLSAQLSLWNQQGSRVRRGDLLVIPIGRGLLYAQPIYLQAERSPMPELRLVVLALQDRLSYAPTFEAALAGLFGEAPAALTMPEQAAPLSKNQPAAAPSNVQALIARAAAQMADYQRLTAAGKLGDAGQKLEELKHTLDELAKRR
ncbi:MAG TPA: UPF0182 family protein [Vicinamibacterales bacterium]|nr:UPF0182 family protein [Vicinamibacterales bacterium]